MADQGKWFKLWCSVLNDQHLDAADIADFGRWCKLGVVVKQQGTDGRLTLIPPARTLQAQLQVDSWRELILCIEKLPGYDIKEARKRDTSTTNEEGKSVTVNVTVEIVTYEVTSRNWQKYQGDFSGTRVANFRARNGKSNGLRGEEKRREKEEKRVYSAREKTRFSKPTEQEVEQYAESIGFSLSGEKFVSHYEANGWRVGRNPMRNWKAAVRTWKTNQDNYSNGNHQSEVLNVH